MPPTPNGSSTQQATSQHNNDATNQLTPPPILWAQRADELLLTIDVEDCKNPTIKLESDKLYFRGKSDSLQSGYDHKEHEVTIEFYKPIKVEDSKHVVKARGIEFVIIKQDAEWWPRLLKGTTKQHWLKIDFPKWKDEDDSEDEAAPGGGMGGMGGMGGGGQPDFSDFMQQFGNMGGGGMGGMGGMPGMDGLGDDDDESDDDDAEEIPELAPAKGDELDTEESK